MDAEIFSLADKIIEILKNRKVMDLNVLIKESGGSGKDVRKIVDLLERQSLASVDYKLTKVVINWKNGDNVVDTTLNSKYDKISVGSGPSTQYTDVRRIQSTPLASSKYNVKLQTDLPLNKDSGEQPSSIPLSTDPIVSSRRSQSQPILPQPLQTKPSQSSLLDLGPRREETATKSRSQSYNPVKQEEPFPELVRSAKEHKKARSDTSERPEKAEKGKKQAIEMPERSIDKRIAKQEEKLRKEVEAEVKEIEKKLISKFMRNSKKFDRSETVPESNLEGTDIVKTVRTEKEKERAARKEKEKSRAKKNESSTTILHEFRSAALNAAVASETSRAMMQPPARDRSEEYLEAFTVDVSDASEREEKEINTQTLSNDLRGRMDTIRQKKAEIATLARQKAGLLDESYRPLQSRLDAELTIITNIVSERETKIKDLRQRLRSLPEDIGSLEVESMELKNSEAEAKARFDGVLHDMQTLASDIRTLRVAAKGDLVDTKKSMQQQETDLRELKELHTKYRSKELDVETAIASVKGKIEREQQQLNGLESKLLELQGANLDIEQKLDGIETRLTESASYGTSASGFVGKLHDLEKEITSVHTAYSDAKSRLLTDIDRYERELLTLRESIEAGFARKYLTEIEHLTEKHDAEIMAVAEREREIDDQLARKREDLRSQIADARDLQDRLHSMLPRRQMKTVEELKRDISLGSAQGEPDGSADRKGTISRFSDFISKLKKD